MAVYCEGRADAGTPGQSHGAIGAARAVRVQFAQQDGRRVIQEMQAAL
jgi:hypothetical protein